MTDYSTSEIQALIKADQDHYLHPTSSISVLQTKGPKIITRGKGCKVWDINGKEYIDATAGLWYCAIGHGRQEIADVFKEQVETLESYHSFNEFSNVPAIQLAEKVANMTPIKNARVFFTSSGSESNDTIFKLARYYWFCKDKDSKDIIITREKAYHGVSYGAVCATRLPKFHEGFEPLLPGFDVIGTPHCYHCPWGKNYPGCSLECATALEEKIIELGRDNVAAFIAEPVVGTGGVIVPPPGYYEKIKEICERNEVLFIADEVINAFGRTGKNFGIENWPGVVPDIMTIAKAITSGYIQLGAVVLSEEIFEALVPKDKFMHGFTYSGHPLACKVGLANLDVIEKENMAENSLAMGDRLRNGLKARNLPAIGEIRGIGSMTAVELVKDQATHENFDPTLNVRVVEIAYENGLITRPLIGDSLQLSPPLSVSAEEIDAIVKILGDAIAQAYAELG